VSEEEEEERHLLSKTEAVLDFIHTDKHSV